MVYVGIDLHRKRSHVAVVDERGQQLFSRRLVNDPELFRELLAEWLFPNDFEPRVGHQFTFRVPANPKMNFEGLTVRCQVLECDPPDVFTVPRART